MTRNVYTAHIERVNSQDGRAYNSRDSQYNAACDPRMGGGGGLDGLADAEDVSEDVVEATLNDIAHRRTKIQTKKAQRPRVATTNLGAFGGRCKWEGGCRISLARNTQLAWAGRPT